MEGTQDEALFMDGVFNTNGGTNLGIPQINNRMVDKMAELKLKWGVSVQATDKFLPDMIQDEIIFTDGKITKEGIDAVCDQIKRSMVIQAERVNIPHGQKLIDEIYKKQNDFDGGIIPKGLK